MDRIASMNSPPSLGRATIVVVNHNYGEFLTTSIDSALAQDHPDVEVVVVDDGSTDNSAAIIAGYGDRIRSVMKAQGGHVEAVNAGFAAATGEVVLFLDADDLLHPDCLHRASALLEPGDSKVQFRLATLDRAGVDQNMPFPHFPPGYSPDDVLRGAARSGWYPWTVSTGNVFTRSFLKRVLPIDSSTVYRSPDGYLSKLAPLYGPVRSLRAVLGGYRVHGKNAWASSQKTWNADVALRWLAFDRVLEHAFVGAAKAQGVAIRQPLLRSFQALEYRMQALRFADPETRPPDRRYKVVTDAVYWLIELHPFGWPGSVARFGWLVFLGYAPRRLVERQVRKARTQTNRSPFWRLMLSLTRKFE
jgi:glycosyltransferase involved in cell wall biosynthesis